MSDLPQGWASATFADVVNSFSNGIGGSQNKEGAGIPVSRIETIADQSINFKRVGYLADYDSTKIGKYKLNHGDILFSHINSPIHLGKTAIYDGNIPLYHGINLLRVVVDREVVYPKTFNYFCKLTRFQGIFALRAQHAVNQSSINQKKLSEFEILVPPRNEQKRIANKLDTVLARVDACRDRLGRIPIILKRFRQAVLAAATSGKLTEAWRSECTSSVSPNEVINERRLHVKKDSERKALELFLSEYPPVHDETDEMPTTWVVTNVGSIGIVSNGSTPSRKNATYWDGDIAWVSSGEVRNVVISSTRERITSDGYENTSVRMLPKGTVLIAMIGEGKTRGQSALLDLVACINQNIAAVIPVENIIYSKYLWYWFQGQYEKNRVVGSGTGPQALNCKRVRELPVNLPPKQEQTEIIRRVESLFAYADRLEARYTTARAKVEKLTPATLAKAFRGELVPQDPNDEPASELLARIKVSQAKNSITPKSKRGRNKKVSAAAST